MGGIRGPGVWGVFRPDTSTPGHSSQNRRDVLRLGPQAVGCPFALLPAEAVTGCSTFQYVRGFLQGSPPVANTAGPCLLVRTQYHGISECPGIGRGSMRSRFGSWTGWYQNQAHQHLTPHQATLQNRRMTNNRSMLFRPRSDICGMSDCTPHLRGLPLLRPTQAYPVSPARS